jgi:hypothetical protein
VGKDQDAVQIDCRFLIDRSEMKDSPAVSEVLGKGKFLLYQRFRVGESVRETPLNSLSGENGTKFGRRMPGISAIPLCSNPSTR